MWLRRTRLSTRARSATCSHAWSTPTSFSCTILSRCGCSKRQLCGAALTAALRRLQTTTKLYLVMDFVNGGHLFFQLYQAGLFEEALARVYTAEIVLALSHLHSLGIAHRGACLRRLPVCAPCIAG